MSALEKATYPVFVGVTRAPWTRRGDDEPCPVKPITKDECRNITRAAILAYLNALVEERDQRFGVNPELKIIRIRSKYLQGLRDEVAGWTEPTGVR